MLYETTMNATMNLNAVKNGIEITFNEKPSDAIRTALKNAGFRWGGKLGYWFAKNTDARLALANELCTPVKETKSKTKKTSKKAAPKAEAETAEKVEIPTVEAAPVEAPEFKLGELSDKVAYTVALKSGSFKLVKGYVFAVTYAGKKIRLGVHKEDKDNWVITELSMGQACAHDVKRYLAVNAVTPELCKKILEVKATKQGKAAAASLKKYNEAHK